MARPIIKSFYSANLHPSNSFISDIYLCFNKAYLIERYIDSMGEIKVREMREFDLDLETLDFKLSKINWWNARREKNAKKRRAFKHK